MRKVVFIFLVLTMSLDAENLELTAVDVINLLLKNNNTILIAQSSNNYSMAIYEQMLGRRKPSVEFDSSASSSPLYGYSVIEDYSKSHTISGGIYANQPLPTGGTASLSLNNALVFSENLTSSTNTITNSPVAGVSIRQPIFGNKKIVDGSIATKMLRQGEIALNLANISEVETRNQIIVGVLGGINSLNSLKNSIVVSQKKLDLDSLEVEMAIEDRSRGRISSSELLAIELGAGRDKEYLFDLKYRLKVLESNLGRVLGIDPSNYTFVVGKKNSNKKDQYSGISYQERMAQLDLENRELDILLNRESRAPVLSLSISAYPSYLDSRDNSDDLGASFSDLFAEGSSFNYSLGLGLNMSIYDGGVAEKQRKADLLTVQKATLNLKEAQLIAKEEKDTLIGKLEQLTDKITLLESTIEYDKQLLERESDLLTIGSSTRVDVELLNLELLSRANDIEDVLGEIYITELELVVLCGGSVQNHILQ